MGAWADGAWATGAWAGTAWAEAASVPVPDVVGLSQAAGTAAIEAEGLVVSVQNGYSGIVAAGDIISQSPTGGSSVASGSTVIIVVSIGAAPSSDDEPRLGRKRGRIISLWGR